MEKLDAKGKTPKGAESQHGESPEARATRVWKDMSLRQQLEALISQLPQSPGDEPQSPPPPDAYKEPPPPGQEFDKEA